MFRTLQLVLAILLHNANHMAQHDARLKHFFNGMPFQGNVFPNGF